MVVTLSKIAETTAVIAHSTKIKGQTRPFVTIIELTTCFHEFSEYESANFFTNISQLKKKTNPLLVQKGIFSQF
jgi:hypothetical protein